MFYREPAPKIIKENTSIVVDRGQLIKALPNSHGDYVFSEVGAGVKPLILVGNLYEITDFLYKNKDKRIHNTIPELPNVYLSAGKYLPKKRFKGIIGVGDIVTTLAKQMLDFFPGTTVSDFSSSAYTFYSILKELMSKGVEIKSDPVYVRLSYLNDDSAINLGEKYIYFNAILCALYSVKKSEHSTEAAGV